MVLKISVVFVVLVATAALAENGYTGYDYRAPAVPNPPIQMPTNLRPNLQQTDYKYMPVLQNEFLPTQVYNHQQNQQNQVLQTQHTFHYNNNGYIYHSAQPSDQNGNYDGFSPIPNNGNLVGHQNAQQNVQASPTRNPSYTSPQPQQPIITKHIYFHLPPPDDTYNAVTVPPAARKKTYNIIFIKLPSQKSASAVRLQQIINHQQVSTESKTFIYVLVKKPETQPVQPVTLKPEVFFVKYKEIKNVAPAVNTGIVQVPQSSSTPVLLPGQVNGHGV